MKVVLTRAGGPLADRLVPRLLAAGHDVRVPAPPDGRPERRRLPLGVRHADAGPADVVIALSPEPASVPALVEAGTRLLVATDRDAESIEDQLSAGPAAWTLQVTTVLHDDLARELDAPSPATGAVHVQPVDADEVAERLVRLLRAAPAGRVPDFGGPEVLAVDAETSGWPPDWLVTRRAAGTVTFLMWSHGSVASEAVEGGEEPQGADPLGGRAGVVQQR